MSEVPSARDLPTDRMSAAERMAATLDPARRPDRVPFVPRVYGYPMAHCGWPVADAYCDAQHSFEGRVALRERLGYDDAFALYAYASMGAWEFGGQIKQPTGPYATAPAIVRHPVTSEDELDALRVPADVSSAGSVPIMLEFARLQDRHGLPVSVDLGSPFTDAANMVEPSLFLKWVVKRPALVHQCLRVMTDFFLALAETWTRLFPGRVIVGFDGTPGEANTLISEGHFREFALPYLREVHEKALAMGVTYFHTHLCGEQNANLDALATIPYGSPGRPGTVSFSQEVPLARAIDLFGEDVIVMGNVDPAKIRFGTAEDVFGLAREAVVAGKDAPLGFVLMSGCEVPVDTPLENLTAMLQATRAYGRYA